jgi:hypothetical protein
MFSRNCEEPQEFTDMQNKLNTGYYNEHPQKFQTDVEKHYGIVDWPLAVKNYMHSIAHHRGLPYGFSGDFQTGFLGAFNAYSDLIILVKLVRKDL